MTNRNNTDPAGLPAYDRSDINQQNLFSDEEVDNEQDPSADGDRFSIVISQDRAGERLDKVISDCMPGQSRSYIKKLIKDGHVTCADLSSFRKIFPSISFTKTTMIWSSISPRTWSCILLRAITAVPWSMLCCTIAKEACPA